MSDPQVIIIGAGLSGLACATHLKRNNVACKIFEASDAVGGRVRTDVVDGFRLDRGFQVFLTSYPEAPQFLDYESLDLKSFKAGALVRYGDAFCRISDVLRHPADLPGNLFSKAASIADKLKIASLRSEVGKLSLAEIEQAENITARQRLLDFGFSEKIIDSFFRPFFGGVFLEPDLATSRRMFDFVFKMFATGEATIPSKGMGEIANQMAANLPADVLSLSAKVSSVGKNSIELASGEKFTCDKIVVATDQNSANQLLNDQTNENIAVTNIYFAANESPINEPILVLNGNSDEGPINNLCVLSDVAPEYAPDGQSLVSITVLGKEADEDKLLNEVVQQATRWYGEQVKQWRHLKTYSIDYALPKQGCQELEPVQKPLTSANGIYRCGDYVGFASIQGALQSGRMVAEQLVN